VVSGHRHHLCRCEAGPPHSNTSGSSHSGGGAVSGSGHLGDACEGVGACLQQQLPGRKEWQPLGFFSKKLETAQQKYSAFDRELYACYAGIRHFRYMLDGRQFAILRLGKGV
jgi:hypothetical protein